MQPQMLDNTISTIIPIHEADRIFSNLLSREETSAAVSSSRAMSYYGRVQSSIPFGWESHPGTPKTAPPSETNPNPNDIILTLTPPPSLYCSPSSSSSLSSSSSSGSPKSPISTKLLKHNGKCYVSPNCVASRLKGNPKRTQTGSTSSSSSSSSLSSLSPSSSWSGPVLSSSAPASRVQRERHRRNSLRSRLQSELTERGFRDRYYENVDRPKSTDSEFSSAAAKFVGARKRATGNKLKGCFAATTLKRAVLAVVGRRSGNRDT